MWGAAPRAALALAIPSGKLFHFDINDGYRLKYDVDIGVGLVNALDWLNVLVLLRKCQQRCSVKVAVGTSRWRHSVSVRSRAAAYLTGHPIPSSNWPSFRGTVK